MTGGLHSGGSASGGLASEGVCIQGGGQTPHIGRPVHGGVLSQHALQVVSQHALQQVSGGGGVLGCYPSMHIQMIESGIFWNRDQTVYA